MLSPITRTAARRAPRLCLAALLLAAAGMSGCESSPFSPGPDRTAQQRRGDFPIKNDDYARLGYRLDWIGYPAITGSMPIQTIIPGDDIVAVQEQGSFITILEANTGTRRCSDQLASPLTKFVGIVRGGNQIFAASQGEVFVLDTQTCNLVGRQRLEKIVSTEPVMFNNLLIFGTGTGELLAALSNAAVSGVKAWGFGANGAFERRPVLIGGVAGAVSQAGDIVFVDAQTGTLTGRGRIFGGATVNPVTDGTLMFVASTDQSIYAFAPDGAQQIWRFRTGAPLTDQPAVVGDRLYCAVSGQGLTAFETGTGHVVWSCKDFGGTVVAMNRKRLLAFNGSEAALIDPARGDIIERVKLPGATMLKPDKFEDGNLYVVSKSGVVAKFQMR